MRSISTLGNGILLYRKASQSFALLRLLSSSAAPESEEENEMIDQRRLPADYDPANFDPSEHRSPPTARVVRLVDEVANLTLAEVTELSSILMQKLSMKDSPTIAVMKADSVGVGGGKTVEKKEVKVAEKTVFELKLESFESAAKLKVIKEVRGVTDLGLKEAKELVEKTPAVFKSGVSKEEGEQIVEKMKAVGAKVVLV